MTIPPDFFVKKPPKDPEGFYEWVDSAMGGVRRFALLDAAVELAIPDNCHVPIDITGLAGLVRLDPFLLELVCEALVAEGFLAKSGDKYHNTPSAELYITRSSPYSQVHYIAQLGRHVRDLWIPLAGNIRNGPVRYDREEFFREFSLPSMADNAVSGRLQATVRAIVSLPGFRSAKKMLDLGGGHGLYTIALVMQNPSLEGYIFDLPLVVPVAGVYINRFGAERVHIIPGDFFLDDFGEGYDLIVSSSNSSGKSVELLPKIAGALNEGGYFVNIQSPGGVPADPLQSLEWQLWTFSGVDKRHGGFSREEPFMTPDYRNAMVEQGLIIIKEQDIRDDYHKDMVVTMVIAEKRKTRPL